MRGYVFISLTVFAFAGCGGGGKKVPTKPVEKTEAKVEQPKETEADREKKRRSLAAAIVPEGSSCLPATLKDENAPRLELAAVGKDAIVCAIDHDRERLLDDRVLALWLLHNLLAAATTRKERHGANPEDVATHAVVVRSRGG